MKWLENTMDMVDNLVDQARDITWASILPAREAIMFQEGIPYLTGSDYSDSMLNTSLEDIEDAYYSN